MADRKGIGGHQSAAAGTTTWLTPPPIVRALGGPESFDLDPCAFPGWPTARHGYSLPDTDGLAAHWFGRVWLNPPYTSGEIGDWLQKLADHGAGTALIFARTETEAFQAQVFERASGLLWLAGRLHFHAPHADPSAACMGSHDAKAHRWATEGPRKGQCEACGVAKANSGAPSILVAYGQDDLDRLAAAELPGHLTPLRFPRFMVVMAVGERGDTRGPAMPAAWREIVLDYARQHGGAVSLSDLYRALVAHPKAKANPNWRAKVRQTLQRAGARRVAPSIWEVPAYG